MANDDDKFTLKIHGLEVDNGLVRADVFVEKLRSLVSALKKIDRLVNGGKGRHQHIITDLQIGLDGGKGMPLLGYETWCEGFDASQMVLAQKVIDLKRHRPEHPQPTLPFVRTVSSTPIPKKD